MKNAAVIIKFHIGIKVPRCGNISLKEGDFMPTKSEKKERNDNKTTNPKSANPITMDVDPNMNKPVRGLDKV